MKFIIKNKEGKLFGGRWGKDHKIVWVDTTNSGEDAEILSLAL